MLMKGVCIEVLVLNFCSKASICLSLSTCFNSSLRASFRFVVCIEACQDILLYSVEE